LFPLAQYNFGLWTLDCYIPFPLIKKLFPDADGVPVILLHAADPPHVDPSHVHGVWLSPKKYCDKVMPPVGEEYIPVAASTTRYFPLHVEDPSYAPVIVPPTQNKYFVLPLSTYVAMNWIESDFAQSFKVVAVGGADVASIAKLDCNVALNVPAVSLLRVNGDR